MNPPRVQFCAVILACVFAKPSPAQQDVRAALEAARREALMNRVQSVSKDGVAITGTIAKFSRVGPNLLRLQIENRGKNTIEINDSVKKTFTISIKTKKGNPVPKASYGAWLDTHMESPGGRNVVIRLAPNKKAEVSIDLGLIFDLTSGGYYSAAIKCTYERGAETVIQNVGGLSFSTEVSLPWLTLQEP